MEERAKLTEWLLAATGGVFHAESSSAHDVETMAEADFDVLVVTSQTPRGVLSSANSTASMLRPRLIVLEDHATLGPDAKAVLASPRHAVVTCHSCLTVTAQSTQKWQPPSLEDRVRGVFRSPKIDDDLDPEVVDALFDALPSYKASLEDIARLTESLSAFDTEAADARMRSAACTGTVSTAAIPPTPRGALKLLTTWSKTQTACSRAKALRRDAVSEEDGTMVSTMVSASVLACERGWMENRFAAAPTKRRRSKTAAATAARKTGGPSPRAPRPPRPGPKVVIRRFE